MKQLGLIGFPLSHSFSKRYFTEKFERLAIKDWGYELFPIESIEELPALIESKPQLVGLNITIPHKINVFPFLTDIDPVANAIGAVNTLSIKRDNTGKVISIKGYNTDEYGFSQSLKPLLQPWHTQGLILGNGGASKAVVYALEKLGIKPFFVSREKKQEPNFFVYNELTVNHIRHFKLIINTTPLGMSPNVESCPELPYEAIGNEHLLYDLVYNPLETKFLNHGRNAGSQAENGMNMLVLQAEMAWEIWKNDNP